MDENWSFFSSHVGVAERVQRHVNSTITNHVHLHTVATGRRHGNT